MCYGCCLSFPAALLTDTLHDGVQPPVIQLELGLLVPGARHVSTPEATTCQCWAHPLGLVVFLKKVEAKLGENMLGLLMLLNRHQKSSTVAMLTTGRRCWSPVAWPRGG